MNKKRFYLFLLVAIFTTLGISSANMILAWIEPGVSAPDMNTPAPINIGLDSQDKKGPLGIGINHANHYGLIVENGILNAKDGLRIEDRNDNPNDVSSRNYRAWVRTDAISSYPAGSYYDSGLYIDIGSRVFHAVGDTALESPLKISKNSIIHNISLVDTSNVRASNIRIKTSSGIKSFRNGYCGNNIVESPYSLEQCDDGNANSGDGCSSTCVCEKPWNVTQPPSCPTACGNPNQTLYGSVSCSGYCCNNNTRPSVPSRWCSATAACCDGSWVVPTAPSCSTVCDTGAYTSYGGSVYCSGSNCCATKPSKASRWCSATASCCAPKTSADCGWMACGYFSDGCGGSYHCILDCKNVIGSHGVCVGSKCESYGK